MPNIIVDGVEIEVRDSGSNLLQALLEHGQDLPYFCWHPAMGSIGACRQCAVLQYRDEEDTRGRIVMACMTPVVEGTRIGLVADGARAFRSAVIENLMLNHPHDCPVCEEGGECHLQDMTVMVGHHARHYRGRKKTFNNQYLGPFIGHEMNRCITCYRCTRYYQDYAGGTDLAAFASRDRVFFGRAEDGTLQSEFAGNLVEVCPTGVFTDKTLSEHYTRKWDLASAPAVCSHCAYGCNTHASERYGELRRIHNRYHNEVNGYFLCDRGRFGGGFVNDTASGIPRVGRRQDDGTFAAVSVAEGLDALADALQGRVVGVGSPRASVEANFALSQLVGEGNFVAGLEEPEAIAADVARCGLGLVPAPTLRDIEAADCVVVVAEDLTQHAPRAALAVRAAARGKGETLASNADIPLWHDAAVRKLAQNDRHPVWLLTPFEDALEDVANVRRVSPGKAAATAAALAEAIRADTGGADADILRDLRHAARPLVLTGSSFGEPAAALAALHLASALHANNPDTRFACFPGEANALGVAALAADSGWHSGLDTLVGNLVGNPRGNAPIDTLVVLENDLTRRMSASAWEALRDRVGTLVVIDYVDTPTATAADLVFPSVPPVACDGTWVNFEGRAQRSYSVLEPTEPAMNAVLWLLRMSKQCERGLASLDHLDDVTAACAKAVPSLARIVEVAPDRSWRARGTRVARMTHRASGRTAMRAQVSVHEPQQPEDVESPLAFTMEGNTASAPAALRTYTWSPGWNSNQSVHKFQDEIDGASSGGDPGVRLFGDSDSQLPDVPEVRATSLVPRPGMFDSDELACRTRAVRERGRGPEISLSVADAAALGATAGDGLSWNVDGEEHSAALRIDPLQADGTVGYTAGSPELAHLAFVAELTFRRAENWSPRPDVIASDGGR